MFTVMMRNIPNKCSGLGGPKDTAERDDGLMYTYTAHVMQNSHDNIGNDIFKIRFHVIHIWHGEGSCMKEHRKFASLRYTQRMLIDEVNEAGFDRAYVAWMLLIRGCSWQQRLFCSMNFLCLEMKF